MGFWKREKKYWVPELVFKLFLKTWLSKGLFAALYRCHGNGWDITNTLKNLYDNSFIQMTKHFSSDRDNSVVIFLHWTRTSNGGKPFRASLLTGRHYTLFAHISVSLPLINNKSRRSKNPMTVNKLSKIPLISSWFLVSLFSSRSCLCGSATDRTTCTWNRSTYLSVLAQKKN